MKAPHQELREEDLQECTFRPSINPRPKTACPVHIKGYEKVVNRLRKVNMEKRALQEKEHKKAIGENYDKIKLMNLKPPSFVSKHKRNLLMYVDVNVTPVKTGRIGIYEGDDVRELARNFQKTF